MPIYQRGKNKTWWLDITTPNGERIRKSSGTENKQQAQELHDKLKAEMWRVKALGAKPRYTWQEAIVKWLSEQEHRKCPKDDLKYLRWLDGYLKDKTLDEIDKNMVDYLKAEKLKTGVSQSTVNHVLAFLRALLNRAKNDWQWLDTVPTIKLFSVKKERIRWLTHYESQKLLKELPEHLKAMVRFSLATGLRESNVTHLTWQQIDMKRRCAWIHADQAKSGKDIAVPLNDDALLVIREQIGKHQIRVFTYKGEPVEKASTLAFRKALKRAGIKDFCWHGLRHTWASWHIQNGTPLHILKELGGWADLTMVMRYAHLSSDHLQNFAGNSAFANQSSVTNLSQAIKKA